MHPWEICNAPSGYPRFPTSISGVGAQTTTWLARRHVAKQHAALTLRRFRRLHQRDSNRFCGRAEVIYDGGGDVLNESPLLLERVRPSKR